MSGIELQQRLRAVGPAPLIIMAVCSQDTVIRERAQQNGYAAFFWKLVDSNALTTTIASLASR